MSIDAAQRQLLRDAEHAHDPALWLRAAGALARAHEHDEAGRALLLARALGAETGPLDDALAPSSLEHERRGVGSLLTAGPLSHFAWGPRSDTLYAVAEGWTILALGVAPGQSRRLKEVKGAVTSLGWALGAERLLIMTGWPDEERALELDLETLRISEGAVLESGPHELPAFAMPSVCIADRASSALTWTGELVPPPSAPEGARKTLRMVFSEESLRLSFPTRRSVERFCELATIGAAGLAPHEIRASVKCLAVSPSGRHAAFARAGSLLLTDLVAEEQRSVPLDGEPLDARWSPSGRRLAVLTALRVHVFTFTG